MRSDEKPWIVVTIGVSTRREKASGTKSAWLWIRSNSPRALEDVGDVEQLPDLGVDACGLPNRAAADAGERARGCESAVANSVTSTPRATSASVSRLVTSSHGP